MEFKNSNTTLKAVILLVLVLLIPMAVRGVIYLSTQFDFSENTLAWPTLFFVAILSFLLINVLIFPVVDMFSTCIIDEAGVTHRLFGRRTHIAWDEIAHIGVGELKVSMAHYRLLLCFSKTSLGDVSFATKPWPNKKQLYFAYREGMLDEVLKYVDETKVSDVQRIKNANKPHELQGRERRTKKLF